MHRQRNISAESHAQSIRCNVKQNMDSRSWALMHAPPLHHACLSPSSVSPKTPCDALKPKGPDESPVWLSVQEYSRP
jgi:hypothetical protein